jgi:hypothetical protein
MPLLPESSFSKIIGAFIWSSIQDPTVGILMASDMSALSVDATDAFVHKGAGPETFAKYT